MTKQDLYVSQMKQQLDELNAKLAELELKAKDARHEAQDRYLHEMHKLREQSKLAGDKLEEMRVAAQGSWASMVAEMETLRHAFINSFHYFKSQT